MLVSFASYDLWVPWQDSGQVLARLFTDYDAGIHWPQVQMQSGVTGINTVRVYSPTKQGLDQDPTGDFTRRWVPARAHIPGKAVHDLLKGPTKPKAKAPAKKAPAKKKATTTTKKKETKKD